ncbi:AraC family transcriptional regulator [Kriegella aquimaris]|uniref:AraC-type DNA-binding protein n=1 Tax=Kriegella aquimaris TaxID=192904 RepID=A0A1G9KIH7_9FLAO|nr:AraC family transcriptional regulator [Kriegella aquimaris]SDL49650.1 AraC-type DNA-binding protein [Kriegella aquimaris]
MKMLEFCDSPPQKDILCFGESNDGRAYDSIRPQSEFQVTLILEGNGSLFVLDKVIPFGQGDLFFFGGNLSNPLLASKIDKANEAFGRSRTVSFFFDERQVKDALKNLPEAYRINKIIECSEYGIKVSKTDHKYLVQQIRRINMALGLKKFLLFLKFIDEVSKNENISVLSTKADLGGKIDKNEPKLRSIFDFIKRNHKETITLEQISEIAHMSPTGFCRFFKTMTQKTFSQYLTEVRIENACELMRNIDYSIADCCYSSGYNNLSNFHRHFKKNTGMSPSQYRTNIKNRFMQ